MSADVFSEHDNEVACHVGDIVIVLADLDELHGPIRLLDDTDLGHIASTIFNPSGNLIKEFDKRIETGCSKLPILRKAQLEPAWRGFGLGMLLAATAIKALSGGARAALCHPAPPDNHDDKRSDPPTPDHTPRHALGRTRL